jgi:SAM-dependent methyltransferase
MNSSEFDKFAEEYAATLKGSIGASGEGPEYFAEYKVRDVLGQVEKAGLSVRRVLDFGCGIGGSVPFFRRWFPAAQLTGVDVSIKSVEIARSRFPEAADYHVFNGQLLPFADDSFDIAFAACVFHHIPADSHVGLLSEIRRVLVPGGMFFIFEHNPLNPMTVRVVNRCPFDENAVLMTAAQLRQRLIEAQFSSVNTSYRVFFPHFLRALRRLESALTWCPLGAQYYLSARK